MTPADYETAKARHADLERKLEARKRLGEGYTDNTRIITQELTLLGRDIAAHEAEMEEE